MSLQKLMPWLVAALAASVIVMWQAAKLDARAVSLAAALLFAAAVVGVALLINRMALSHPHREERAHFHMLRRNTRLIALIYAWGAAALLAVYVLGDLQWRHGWQYGSAMALIAGLLLWYVHSLGNPASAAASPAALRRAGGPLAMLHALAAAGGLVFLVGAGKLATLKGDWAANHVFLAGGLAVIAVSLLSVRTQRRLDA